MSVKGLVVSVRSNAIDVAANFLLEAKQMQDATRIALNKMAEQAKVAAAREAVKAGYKVKVSTIKDGIRITRASNGNLKAVMVTSGRPIPLIAFGARWGGPGTEGVSVSVKNGRKMIKGAFIAQMPGSGHKGVFVREPGGKHRKIQKAGKPQWHQLPIRQLFGPSAPDMVVEKRVVRALIDLYLEKFPRLLQHERLRLLNKIKAPKMKGL